MDIVTKETSKTKVQKLVEHLSDNESDYKSSKYKENEIKKYIKILEDFSKDYSIIGIEATFHLEKNNKEGKSLYPLDVFILSTIIRSYSLTKGFCNEINLNNSLCAISIVRMHFDTLLNLYSLYIVKDPFKCSENALKGKHIQQNKFVDKNINSEGKIAKAMSESNLIKIDGTGLYKNYSRYIHFSEEHMNKIMQQNKSGKFKITVPDGFLDTDNLVINGCKDMLEITRNLFILWKNLDKLGISH